MAQKLKVSGIVEESVVDGPGIRFVVFTQGCPHCCKGCHNPQTHNPEGGFWMDTREILERFAENPLLTGITFSGGEPFLQAGPLCALAREVKNRGKDVVTYTGYTFEELLKRTVNPMVTHLLAMTDILIDGPYIEALRDLSLQHRGSRNQRILDRNARISLMSAHHMRQKQCGTHMPPYIKNAVPCHREPCVTRIVRACYNTVRDAVPYPEIY